MAIFRPIFTILLSKSNFPGQIYCILTMGKPLIIYIEIFLLLRNGWPFLNCYLKVYRSVFKPDACRPQAGACLVSWNFFCADVCMCVYVCVCLCPPPRLLITSGMMWRDMDSIRLVKQILQLLYGNCSRYR